MGVQLWAKKLRFTKNRFRFVTATFDDPAAQIHSARYHYSNGNGKTLRAAAICLTNRAGQPTALYVLSNNYTDCGSIHRQPAGACTSDFAPRRQTVSPVSRPATERARLQHQKESSGALVIFVIFWYMTC